MTVVAPGAPARQLLHRGAVRRRPLQPWASADFGTPEDLPAIGSGAALVPNLGPRSSTLGVAVRDTRRLLFGFLPGLFCGFSTGGSHRRSTLVSLSSRSARRRDRWARLGRDFGKSWVQDFESRLGVIVEPGLGRVRGAWRRTSQTRLGGSSSARGIVAPSSRSGMTGTLRSGAEMVPSDSAITARLSSLLMPRREAQSKPRKRGADDRKNRHGA